MSPLFVFIYLPVVVLVLFSFHAGQVPVPPFRGPSLEWYGKVLASERITDSAFNSIVVGVLSSSSRRWRRGDLRATGFPRPA